MATEADNRATRHPLLLWTGWLMGPLAWALHLMASYLLVPWVCSTGHYWSLHMVTLLTALLAAAGALIAWRQLRGAGRPAGHGKPYVRRVRFMAINGMIISGLSVLIILVEGLPTFILSACI